MPFHLKPNNWKRKMPQVYKMAHATESRVENRPVLEIEGDRWYAFGEFQGVLIGVTQSLIFLNFALEKGFSSYCEMSRLFFGLCFRSTGPREKVSEQLNRVRYKVQKQLLQQCMCKEYDSIQASPSSCNTKTAPSSNFKATAPVAKNLGWKLVQDAT